MPLVQLANGPLSATGPVQDVILDDEADFGMFQKFKNWKKAEILKSYKENKENKFDEYVVPVATEEKADVSHFNLLKVLGQGTWFIFLHRVN